MVILVQSQDDEATAGQLDGVQVLHLGGVQVTVGDDDGGLGVVSGCVFGHVQQAAQFTVTAVKADAAHINLTAAAVDGACQEAAQQDQDKTDRQQTTCALAQFHVFPPFFSLIVSIGNNRGLNYVGSAIVSDGNQVTSIL